MGHHLTHYLFLDELNFVSLLKLLSRRKTVRTVFVYDKPEGLSLRILMLLRKLKWIAFDFQTIAYNVGQIRDDQGKNRYADIWKNIRDMALAIKEHELKKDHLTKALGAYWEYDKILLYMEKKIEMQIRDECMRIDLSEWIVKHQLDKDPRCAALLIKKQQWGRYISKLADTKDLKVYEYKKLPNVLVVLRTAIHVMAKTISVLQRVVSMVYRQIHRPSVMNESSNGEQHPSPSPIAPKATTIAVRHWFGTLDLHDSTRSALFWVNDRIRRDNNILVYNYRGKDELTKDKQKELLDHGITVSGNGHGLPSSTPSPAVFKFTFQNLSLLFVSLIRCLIQGRWIKPYYVIELLVLSIKCAYWTTFFKSHAIRVNIGFSFDIGVPQVLALDKLNGVTIAIQYSVSFILLAASYLTAGEDAQFVFSQKFAELWKKINAPTKCFPESGTIFVPAKDRSMKKDTGNVKIREALGANGAEFIIGYMDENSADRWDVFSVDDDVIEDYQFMLNWLISDPSVGMVFKPKRSDTLFQRLSPIRSLIQTAQSTGRCHFYSSNQNVSEIAQITDLCIGHLVGTTAALETSLSGKPTLLYDNLRLVHHPVYHWQGANIIFNTWQDLRSEIEKYRTLPDKQKGLGDWGPYLHELDPFQDGKSGERIGDFIQWVIESLSNGDSKTVALTDASQKFSERWGRPVGSNTPN